MRKPSPSVNAIKALSFASTLMIGTVLQPTASWNSATAQTNDNLPNDSITLDRVFFAASPKWHLLTQKAVAQNGELFFRKYSFPVLDEKIEADPADVKNIISYACQRTRAWDYVVFHLPTSVQLKTIDTTG